MGSEKGKLLITPYQDKILSLLVKDNRLLSANAFPKEGSLLNGIYIGKVTNVVKNIEAAFVEIFPGQVCFLPLAECKNIRLVNRNFDGRLIAGDEIVVQVIKEAVKTKQPVLSSNLSFTGVYCVVTTGEKRLGYSSKLNETEKAALKQYISSIKDSMDREKFGYVIRTNCRELEGNYQVLKEEILDLTKQAETLLKTAGYKTCYSRLWEGSGSYLDGVRRVYQSDYDEIITDDREIYETLCRSGICTDRIHTDEKTLEDSAHINIRFYEDAYLPLQKLYSVETKLSEALSKNVWLRSGGYLVIEPTEALTVIDVNTGRSIANRNAEEHYFKINLEAAAEIAVQLRLRNISGIILVDFINMQSKEKETQLLFRLKELLKKDSIKTSVIDITELGLVEITRKKINKPLAEQLKAGREK